MRDRINVFRASVHIRKLLASYYPPKEEELTRHFLEKLCANHRIRAYMTTRSYEAKVGADWLWLIFTNSGITPFLVQAKKLEPNQQQIIGRQARFKSHSGAYQIDLLAEASEKTGIPALYVLYADSINRVPCGSVQPKTNEGVYFDLADHIHDHFFGTGKKGLKHMPISCLFACMARKCRYFPKDKYCRSCLKCKHGKRSAFPSCRVPENACISPFDQFFQRNYGKNLPIIPIDTHTVPLLYCDTILQKHPEYIPGLLSKQAADAMELCERIIITDYMNRHDQAYAASIMGPDFILDTTTVYDQTEILKALADAMDKYTVFDQLGLFGSYARKDEDGKTEARNDSDIDIAIVYNERIFHNQEAFVQVSDFVTEMMNRFHKNIDFVDYVASLRNPNCRDFIRNIRKTMIWV